MSLPGNIVLMIKHDQDNWSFQTCALEITRMR